jgi:hypothetical protein
MGTWHAPASFLQERWFHSTVDHRCNHNNVVAWQVEGPVAPAALVAAVRALAGRHETLRTSLHDHGDGVRQTIAPPGAVPVWQSDVSGSAQPERDLDKLIIEAAERSFLLTEAPLWHAGLVRLDESRHVLVLVVSHAVSDGWSMGVLFRDFSRLLQAVVTGADVWLPELAVQFGDYAAWERAAAEPRRISWWRERLPDPRPCFPGLPGYRRESAFRMDGRVFPASGTPARLAELARPHGGGLAAAVTAGVLATLSPYAGGEVVLGFLHANRDRPEMQPVVGPVFDYLPLVLTVSGTDSFAELVRRACEEQRAARGHRLPLGVLERAVDRQLFDVAVEFLPHSQVAPTRVAGLEVTPYPVPELTVRHSGDVSFAATVPLNYITSETPSALGGVVYGNALAVAPRTMGELGDTYARVLARASDDPAQRVCDMIAG